MILEIPSKRIISFDEANHLYTDECQTKYISVTTLIKNYEKPFDREYWLKEKSEKLGIDSSELSLHWDYLRDSACEKGTATHNYIENKINKIYSGDAKQYSPSGLFKGEYRKLDLAELNSSELQLKHPKVYLTLTSLIFGGWTLYAEKRIYNPQLGICGTIDVFAIKGKEFIIVDWKTNKKPLYFHAGYYKKNWQGIETNKWINTDDVFKNPLSHITYCKGEVYTLQLSLYAYLAEAFGLTCRGLVLYHLMDNDDYRYDIKYRKNDIKLMTEHYYNNK